MLSKKLKDIDFLKNTIMILKKENPSADLQLLENLVNEGLEFIFKEEHLLFCY